MSVQPTHLTGSLFITGSVSASLGFDGLSNVFSASAQVAHDSTTGFVSAEHVDHSGVSITGTGALTGGGTIEASRTIALDTSAATFTNGVVASLPTGTVSASAQTIANLPTGTVSGSAQLPTGIVSSSAQMDTLFNLDGVVSSSAQVAGFGARITSGAADMVDGEIVIAVGKNAITSSDALAVDSDGNLGIGTTSPDVRLHMVGDGAETTQFRMDQYNDTTDAADIRIRRARGTQASPSDLQAGDYIFRLNVQGRDAGAFREYAALQFDVDDDQDACIYRLKTRGDSGGSSVTRYSIDGSGLHSITGSVEFKDVVQNIGGVRFSDNISASFGDANDLQIYHDGSHSRIKDAGVGHLTINATDFVVNNSADTKNMIIATDGGSVNLYYDASQKFRTVSAGAEVTGQLDVSGLTNTGTFNSEGNATVSGSLIVSSSIGDNPFGVLVKGAVSASGDVIAFQSSDERLKDNIQPIESPLEKIFKINGVSFDWNDKQDLYSGRDVGVIAQEIETVLPEIVQTRESGMKAVRYEKIVALLIEAIKEQQLQIDELKARL